MRRLLVVIAVLAVLPAAVAVAAPPWSDPVTLQDGVDGATPIGLVATPHGSLVGGWNFGAAPAGESGQLVLRPAGAGTASTVPVGTQLSAGPVAYASDHAALMPVRFGRVAGGYVQQTLYLRTVDAAGGQLSHSVRLVHDAVIVGTALAGDARGDVAAAWIERRGHHEVVAYAVRGRGGTVGHAHVVSGSGHAEAVALAYDGRGDLLVAYARYRDGRRSVIARVQAVRHGVGHETQLGTQTGLLRIVAAGQASAPRFAVAWQTEDPSGAGPGFPPRVYATTRNTLGHFAPTRTLDDGTVSDYASGAIQAGWAGDGLATVAWSEPTAAGQQPRAATAGASGRFAVADLAGRGAVTGLEGRTVLVTGAGVQAYDRAGSAFGAAQELDGDVSDRDALLAAEPGGRLDALWTGASGSGQAVRLATR